MNRYLLCVLLLWGLVVAAAMPTLAAVQGYSIRTLDLPAPYAGGSLRVVATNSAGTITVAFTSAGGCDCHVAIVEGDTWTLLGVPGATLANCSSMNSEGKVALGYSASGDVAHTDLYWHGRLLPFPDAPLLPFYVNALSDSGLAAGVYVDEYGHNFGAVSTPKGYALLDYPMPTGEPTCCTGTFGINNAGVVAGIYAADSTWRRGFLYDSRREIFSPVEVPGRHVVSANAISNRGELVGRACPGEWASPGSGEGFSLLNGRYTAIKPPNAACTIPNSVTDSGQVAGTYWVHDCPNSCIMHGFIATPVEGGR